MAHASPLRGQTGASLSEVPGDPGTVSAPTESRKPHKRVWHNATQMGPRNSFAEDGVVRGGSTAHCNPMMFVVM